MPQSKLYKEVQKEMYALTDSAEWVHVEGARDTYKLDVKNKLTVELSQRHNPQYTSLELTLQPDLLAAAGNPLSEIKYGFYYDAVYPQQAARNMTVMQATQECYDALIDEGYKSALAEVQRYNSEIRENISSLLETILDPMLGLPEEKCDDAERVVGRTRNESTWIQVNGPKLREDPKSLEVYDLSHWHNVK